MDVSSSRAAEVGGQQVRRALPQHRRRTVGAWCFADHFGPTAVTGHEGVNVGPHPHLGLHTVTWLVSGELLHRDSLGSEQLIRPGELNLMTAGGGISHAEEATGSFRGDLHGIQLWVAQPEATRHGEPAFEHHASLPVVDLGTGSATVLVGDLGGVASSARRDSELVGAEIRLHGGTTDVPLQAGFEHALVVLEGTVTVEGEELVPGQLGHLDAGTDELGLAASGPATPAAHRWGAVPRTGDDVLELRGSQPGGAGRGRPQLERRRRTLRHRRVAARAHPVARAVVASGLRRARVRQPRRIRSGHGHLAERQLVAVGVGDDEVVVAPRLAGER